MAITRVGVVEVAPATSASSALILPAGIADDDVIVVRFHREDTTAVAPPGGQGYVRVDPLDSIATGGTNADTVFVATLQAADASQTHTFTHASTWRHVQAIILRGADVSDILAIRDPAAATSGTGTSATTPSEGDPGVAGMWVLLTMCSWADATKTFPATLDGETVTTEYGGSAQNLGLARAEYSPSAAIGAASVTHGAAPTNWLGKTIAIRPDTGLADAPAVVGAGTAAFTATNGVALAPGLPTGWAADDIFVLLGHRSDNVTGSGPASGWIALSLANNTVAQRVEVYVRRAVAGDTAPSLFSNGTIVRGARIVAIRGVDPALDLTTLQFSRSNNAASATVTFATLTPTEARGTLLALYAYEDDPSAAAQIDGWTDFSVSTSALGNDAALGYAWRTWPVASSATGALTSTVSGGTFANSANVGMVIAFPPIVSGAHTDSSVAGSQPAATGTLARILGARRAPSGSQPAPAGALARVLAALRTPAGAQPAPSGVLSRVLAAPRGAAGSQPAPAGTLAAAITFLRAAAGAQPAAGGALASLRGYVRALAGAQPASTGTLARLLTALRSTAGSQPAATGTLTRVAASARGLTGSQPAPSATLAGQQSVGRQVAGVQPSATGTLARILAAIRAPAGAQQSATGILARLLATARAPAGSQPAPAGSLARSAGRARSPAGSQPAPSGMAAAQFSASRTVSGTQSAGTGALARLLATTRHLVGTQPEPSGSLARSWATTGAPTGAQPAPSGTLTAFLGTPMTGPSATIAAVRRPKATAVAVRRARAAVAASRRAVAELVLVGR